MHRFLRKTMSLCPDCLKRIEADIVEIDGKIYMQKSCPDHGSWDVLFWEESGEHYLKWINDGGTPLDNDRCKKTTRVSAGCPFDCGICSHHAADISSAALMTSNVCDVNCPICFTKDSSQGRYMPELDELFRIAASYKKGFSGDHPIELCGGEPTVRDDLPELAAGLRDMGFHHIQLNTNGIRIANDFPFLKKLKENGVTVVYLGFDGLDPQVYIRKYGQDLLDIKLRAIRNCAEAELAVVLVPVIIKGVNDGALGDIIQTALDHMPAVKGVYFQPVSFFGRYPGIPNNEERITIPAVLKLLEEQTDGVIARNHFNPGGSEHALCSFTSFYMANRRGQLKAVTRSAPRGITEESARKVIEFNEKAWSWSENRTLTVDGMHFMDVWNIDLERLKKCRICILGEDESIIPLCAKYVTSTTGKKLYSGIA